MLNVVRVFYTIEIHGKTDVIVSRTEIGQLLIAFPGFLILYCAGNW